MSAAAAALSSRLIPTALRTQLSSTTQRRGRTLASVTRAVGHEVGKDSVMSEESVDPEIAKFQEHQAGAARLPFADECRTLVAGPASTRRRVSQNPKKQVTEVIPLHDSKMLELS